MRNRGKGDLEGVGAFRGRGWEDGWCLHPQGKRDTGVEVGVVLEQSDASGLLSLRVLSRDLPSTSVCVCVLPPPHLP